MKKGTIAITMGEPGGIGPEVIVKALYSPEIRNHYDALIIGSVTVMREAVALTGLPLKVRAVSDVTDVRAGADSIHVLEIKSPLSKSRGESSAKAGIAVVKYIKRAVRLALKNRVSAIVTAPLSKESLNRAGYTWPGHTELLAELTEAKDVSMMFNSDRLKVILCTIHIPLKNVPRKITKSLVSRTIRFAGIGMGMLGIDDPRIAVAGLNPHAGESGIMGKEEAQFIVPAIEKAKKRGVQVSGPYPPDVVFQRAYNGEFDIVVSMYHDQGLIPFKMLAFDTGVNMTVGLPVIRTSPDHGTAFDIAWKNMASPSSMIEAIKLAGLLKMKTGANTPQ